jgi:hypothetical protein
VWNRPITSRPQDFELYTADVPKSLSFCGSEQWVMCPGDHSVSEYLVYLHLLEYDSGIKRWTSDAQFLSHYQRKREKFCLLSSIKCLSVCLSICLSVRVCSVRQKEFHYVVYGDVTKFILHERILILDRRRIINASSEDLWSAIIRACRTQLLNFCWREYFWTNFLKKWKKHFTPKLRFP